jgi:hypothetical protein
MFPSCPSKPERKSEREREHVAETAPTSDLGISSTSFSTNQECSRASPVLATRHYRTHSIQHRQSSLMSTVRRSSTAQKFVIVVGWQMVYMVFISISIHIDIDIQFHVCNHGVVVVVVVGLAVAMCLEVATYHRGGDSNPAFVVVGSCT